MEKSPNAPTPQHCPGFENYRDLEVFSCKCPECGEVKEIFSDEFNKPHSCSGCGKPIDFTKCSLDGSAKSTDSR